MGVPVSAFTAEETAKLKNHSSPERATQFTEHMYFPFLLCEAKSGDQVIDQADRQNMHSGSLACRAIWELERAVGDDRARRLSGEILVYSISHDNERVKIYGHFAVCHGERTTFHRYPIGSFVLNFDDRQGRQRTHDFVREVYRTAFPQHLQRIQDALKEMDDPWTQTVTTSLGQVELGMPSVDGSVPSAQDAMTCKVAGTPVSKQHHEELSLLGEQFAQQERRHREQMARHETQYRELMAQQEKQMAQQEKQMAQQEKQMAQQEKQMAQQEKQMAQQEKQLDVLNRLLDQQ